MDQTQYIPDSQSSFGIVSEVFRKNFIKLASIYLVGIVPFQVFLVYFFLELSYTGSATQKVFPLSILGFVLFCWMKAFQSIYATHFYYMIQEESVPVIFRFKEIFYQVCVQSSSLFVYALSLTWVFTLQASYNFYNYSLIVTPEKQELSLLKRLKFDLKNGKSLIENARLSTYFLGIIIFVFINVLSLLLIMPYLLQMFLGIETIFLKSISGFFNLITFLIMFNLTFLACDPFFKGAYGLRYYYKIALPKGGDLQFRLKKILKIVVLLLMVFVMPHPSSAKENTKENLQEVLNQKKYQWREGKKVQLEEPKDSYVMDLLQRIYDWLFNGDNAKEKENDKKVASKNDFFNGDLLTPVLKILLVFFIGALCLIVYRNYKVNKKFTEIQAKPIEQSPVVKKPEEDKFDDYNEDEWARAARDLVQQGDYRGAIRALYYQVLMTLGEKNLLLIKRYKTNSQYRSELNSRAHSLPEVNGNFVRLILAFEEAWFSNKDISESDFEETSFLVHELKGKLNG